MRRSHKPMVLEKPSLPALSDSGAYVTGELIRYILEAMQARMSEIEMAEHLQVPLDRLVFFMRKAMEAADARRN